MAKAPTTQRRTRNPAARAAFFDRKDEIAAALKAGAFMRQIYDSQTFPGSYMQFTRYCARYLGHGQPAAAEGPALTVVREAPVAASLSPASPGPAGDGPKRAVRAPAPAWDPSNLNRAELFGPGKDDK